MRKILANAHVSLDGVVQSPGGPDEDPRNGFAHGGWTAPLVLGRGKRLFERDVPAQALTLVDTKTTSTGVMFNTYRPAS